jgi:hypothetical protein
MNLSCDGSSRSSGVDTALTDAQMFRYLSPSFFLVLEDVCLSKLQPKLWEKTALPQMFF